MRNIWLYVILLLFGVIGCEKDDGEVKNKGEVVLTSEKTLTGDLYIVYGYSFSQGKNIPYSITGGTRPDIVVSNEYDIIDTVEFITGATLFSPKNDEAFLLNETFYGAEEAKEYFDNYQEIVGTSFQPMAQNIKVNQVWTIQTYDKRYAKFLIIDIKIKTDSPIDDYVEITIEYVYQPDGSKTFGSNLRN